MSLAVSPGRVTRPLPVSHQLSWLDCLGDRDIGNLQECRLQCFPSLSCLPPEIPDGPIDDKGDHHKGFSGALSAPILCLMAPFGEPCVKVVRPCQCDPRCLLAWGRTIESGRCARICCAANPRSSARVCLATASLRSSSSIALIGCCSYADPLVKVRRTVDRGSSSQWQSDTFTPHHHSHSNGAPSSSMRMRASMESLSATAGVQHVQVAI